ncbi:MAG: ATP-dependent Clp protease ATP-binding subunit ClpX, partial [Clostridia bacterium]|nr:ATP-dependent Clp protease ATP-binding subunit ClpX [Clostridia bacterium]
MPNNNGTDKKRICAFCKKEEKDVGRLILGPDGINICSSCIAVCADILESLEEDEKNKSES